LSTIWLLDGQGNTSHLEGVLVSWWLSKSYPFRWLARITNFIRDRATFWSIWLFYAISVEVISSQLNQSRIWGSNRCFSRLHRSDKNDRIKTRCPVLFFNRSHLTSMSVCEVNTENYAIADEQTALLPTKDVEKPTPLPRLQISILLLMQLAEPITSQCILPFINEVTIRGCWFWFRVLKWLLL
jgi:hypothetical protein